MSLRCTQAFWSSFLVVAAACGAATSPNQVKEPAMQELADGAGADPKKPGVEAPSAETPGTTETTPAADARATAGDAKSASSPAGADASASGGDTAEPAAPPPPPGKLLDDIKDHSTKALGTGKVVKTGWNQKDMLPNANWDGAMTGCPDPDAMVVPGTVAYKDGNWTLTGSGEGFMHGWDQGNLVYFESKVTGDFDFTAQATELAAEGSFSLNGAAEAILNVRDGLDPKNPSNSIIAGRMKGRTTFMGRFHWKRESPPNGEGRKPEDKYWYWPAWPVTWPKEPSLPWMRISRRGTEFRAYVSKTGAEGDWQEVKNADSSATWYPFKLKTFGPQAILGLVCTARNDRNGAPKKPDGCRDENSALLKQSARCVFKNVSIVQR